MLVIIFPLMTFFDEYLLAGVGIKDSTSSEFIRILDGIRWNFMWLAACRYNSGL